MYARTYAKATTDPKPSHLALGRTLAGKDSRLAPQHEIQPLSERDRGPAESSTPAVGNRPVAGFSFGNLAIGPTERLGIQTKLTIGQPHDRYEQEADLVADQVMQMPAPSQMATSTSGPPSIQRLCPECEEDLQRQPQSVTEEDEKKKKRLQTKPLISSIPLNLQRQVVPTSEEDERKKKHLQKKPSSGANLEASPDLQERMTGLHGGGQPLSNSERTFLEPRFGYDFSQVRLHTDERAAEMARSVNARAFTLGQDVVFGSGQYQPRSTEGQRLLAHELTHVVQQSGTEYLGTQQDSHSSTLQCSCSACQQSRQIDIHSLSSPAIQRLEQSLPYVGPLGSYLNPLNQLARAVLPGLSPSQKALLDGIFGNSLATSIIRLNPNSLLAAGKCYRTTGNIINMPDTTISDSHLIHEAAHVWQHQNTLFGVGYAVSALRAQAIAQVLGGDWQRAYDYKNVERYRIPWRYWNAEQQAQWIEDNRRLPSGWMLQADLPDLANPLKSMGLGGPESAGIE